MDQVFFSFCVFSVIKVFSSFPFLNVIVCAGWSWVGECLPGNWPGPGAACGPWTVNWPITLHADTHADKQAASPHPPAPVFSFNCKTLNHKANIDTTLQLDWDFVRWKNSVWMSTWVLKFIFKCMLNNFRILRDEFAERTESIIE